MFGNSLAIMLVFSLSSQDQPITPLSRELYLQALERLEKYLANLSRISIRYHWQSPTESTSLVGLIEHDQDKWYASRVFIKEVPEKGKRRRDHEEAIFDGRRWRTHHVDPDSGNPKTVYLEDSEPKFFPEAHPFNAFGLLQGSFGSGNLAWALRHGKLQMVRPFAKMGINVFSVAYKEYQINMAFEDKSPNRLVGWERTWLKSRAPVLWTHVVNVLEFREAQGTWYPCKTEMGFRVAKNNKSPLLEEGRFVIEAHRGVMMITDLKLYPTKNIATLIARESKCQLLDELTGETRFPPKAVPALVQKGHGAVAEAKAAHAKSVQAALDAARADHGGRAIDARPSSLWTPGAWLIAGATALGSLALAAAAWFWWRARQAA